MRDAIREGALIDACLLLLPVLLIVLGLLWVTP
jgi:hypothetical protein